MILLCRGLNCSVVRVTGQILQFYFTHIQYSLQEDLIVLTADSPDGIFLQPGDRVYLGVEFEASNAYHQVS